MIETILLDYLNSKKEETGAEAFMEVPRVEPDKYIVLEKTSSSEADYICSSTFAIQSVAPSLYESAELSSKVKTALASLNDWRVSKITLNSEYNYTDIASKKYRYQAVFDLIHYEV